MNVGALLDELHFIRVCSGAGMLRPLSEADVKTYVAERLARFKVPRDVIFLDELPRNPTGKVVKRLLRQRASAQDAAHR
jgi:acyl-CoA synthetase (AMP-forming)/AMP-acid ligase II